MRNQNMVVDIILFVHDLLLIFCFNKEILNDNRVLDVVEDVKNILKLDGKVLVRASGTEPLVRVTISCETESDLDKYMDLIVSIINNLKEEV